MHNISEKINDDTGQAQSIETKKKLRSRALLMLVVVQAQDAAATPRQGQEANDMPMRHVSRIQLRCRGTCTADAMLNRHYPDGL